MHRNVDASGRRLPLPAGPGGDVTVTDGLRDDILEGTFPPGGRLVEISLSERYGVGRAAIRSALLELDAEGLVEREANRGAKVRRISVDEAIELAEARAVLEGLIAGRAARGATAAEKTELEAIVVAMREAVGSEDQLSYSKLNVSLHRRLREISRHAVADELVAKLRNRAAHHQYRLALMPGRSQVSLVQHEAIVAAVVAGDEAAARDAMHTHLESVAEILQEWAEMGVTV